MAAARQILVSKYGMSENPEVLLAFADTLYSQFRYADCFAITTLYVPPNLAVCCFSADSLFHIEYSKKLRFTLQPFDYT